MIFTMVLSRPVGLLLALLVTLLPVSRAAAQPTSRAQTSAVLNYTALQPGQQAVVAIPVDIKPGYHAQSNKPLDENLIPLKVTPAENQAYQAFEAVYPAGHIAEYPGLGKMSVYDGRVIIYVPVEVKAGATPGPVTIAGKIQYQICDDKACYAPETKAWEVATEIVSTGQPVAANQPELFQGFDPRLWSTLKPASAVDAAATPAQMSGGEVLSLFGWTIRLGADTSYVVTFSLAFLVGLIFNVVPCVLPVLPLKAIGFYEVAQHNRAKCFALGIAFSLGIIATFGALAMPVVVFKALQWGELFGNPWFAGAITLILLGMAAQMFGLFGVNLPTWLYTITPRHDTYSGNFLFGILTAVLSTPCTFGLFLGLLVWATAQPAVVGVAVVMVVGLGMASPYLVLSGVPELARRFPRSGPWSEVVKQMMGFFLVGVALYFGQIFLPQSMRGPGFWWVLFACVAAAGVFLIVRAIQLAPRATPIAIAVAVALLLTGPALAVTLKLANPPLTWTYYSPEELEKARAAGKPVVVKFTATWCANCQTVEATVYGNEDTVQYIRQHGIVPLKADLTDQSAKGWDLLRQLHPVGAIPFTAVYLPGDERPRTLAGIYSSDDLKAAIESKPSDATAMR